MTCQLHPTAKWLQKHSAVTESCNWRRVVNHLRWNNPKASCPVWSTGIAPVSVLQRTRARQDSTRAPRTHGASDICSSRVGFFLRFFVLAKVTDHVAILILRLYAVCLTYCSTYCLPGRSHMCFYIICIHMHDPFFFLSIHTHSIPVHSLCHYVRVCKCKHANTWQISHDAADLTCTYIYIYTVFYSVTVCTGVCLIIVCSLSINGRSIKQNNHHQCHHE